jgi:hypothetical protein
MVKIALAFGVLGLLGYDGFVTVATHLKAENDAQNAAYAASQWWYDNPDQRNVQGAYEAALEWEAANNPSDHICMGVGDPDKDCVTEGNFSVDPDGTVHLVVRRHASTFIFKHLGFMKSYLTAYEHGDASTNAG